MTKQGLIESIVAKVGCSQADAGRALDAILETITKSLTDGDSVTITGFGTFSARARAARAGVNPKTGEKIQIPAMTVPKFKKKKRKK
jgi:DNA-binding protein HU-beta